MKWVQQHGGTILIEAQPLAVVRGGGTKAASVAGFLLMFFLFYFCHTRNLSLSLGRVHGLKGSTNSSLRSKAPRFGSRGLNYDR